MTALDLTPAIEEMAKAEWRLRQSTPWASLPDGIRHQLIAISEVALLAALPLLLDAIAAEFEAQYDSVSDLKHYHPSSWAASLVRSMGAS